MKEGSRVDLGRRRSSRRPPLAPERGTKVVLWIPCVDLGRSNQVVLQIPSLTSERSPRGRSHLRSPRIVLEDSDVGLHGLRKPLLLRRVDRGAKSRQPTLSLPVCSFALKISRGMMYHYLFLFFSSAEEGKGVVEEEEEVEEGNRI